MKYKDGNFIQLDRGLFKHKISWQAKWLYTVLTELEHRYTTGWEGKGKNFFWRTAEGLAEDSGLGVKTIRKYRRELEEVGLIKTWKYHPFIDKEKKTRSKDAVTAYQIKR